MGFGGFLIIHSMIHVSKEFMLQQRWDQVHKSGQRISRVQLAVGSQPLNYPSGVAQWCWHPGYFYYQPILNPMSYWKTNQFCPGREDMVFCGYSCFYNEIGEKNKILRKKHAGEDQNNCIFCLLSYDHDLSPFVYYILQLPSISF